MSGNATKCGLSGLSERPLCNIAHPSTNNHSNHGTRRSFRLPSEENLARSAGACSNSMAPFKKRTVLRDARTCTIMSLRDIKVASAIMSTARIKKPQQKYAKATNRVPVRSLATARMTVRSQMAPNNDTNPHTRDKRLKAGALRKCAQNGCMAASGYTSHLLSRASCSCNSRWDPPSLFENMMEEPLNINVYVTLGQSAVRKKSSALHCLATSPGGRLMASRK